MWASRMTSPFLTSIAFNSYVSYEISRILVRVSEDCWGLASPSSLVLLVASVSCIDVVITLFSNYVF
jgi:hypothetical protein